MRVVNGEWYHWERYPYGPSTFQKNTWLDLSNGSGDGGAEEDEDFAVVFFLGEEVLAVASRLVSVRIA